MLKGAGSNTPIFFRPRFGRIIYIDASQDDALLLLPPGQNTPNREGVTFTLKRTDTSRHTVRVKSEDGTLIEGKPYLTLKPKCKKCCNGHRIKRVPADPVHLQLANSQYWIV